MSIYKNTPADKQSLFEAKIALASFLKQPADSINCTLLAGGFDEGTIVKCVHNDKKYIVKLFQNPVSGKREGAWTQHASSLCIGPKFYYADPAGRYIIMEFVDGKSLGPTTANNPIILKNIATSVALLHCSFAPFAQASEIFPRIEAKYKRLETSGELKELLANLWKYLKKIEPEVQSIIMPSAPCQNDLNPRNVFAHENKITIIDWGDAILGNPYYDIAIFFVLNAIKPENEKFFLEQYDPRLLEPQLHRYLDKLKQLLRFEFALNLLSGVQELNSKMLHAEHLPEVNKLNYYLTLFAQQEVETGSEFIYAMAIASLNEMQNSNM